MLIVAISYIVFFIVCVLLLNRRGANERQDKILWGLMAFALAVIAYLFDPTGTGLDVVRHFQIIDSVRDKDISFIRFILGEDGGYSGLYAYNILCYLIARLGLSNHVLPFCVTLCSYSICFYILRDWRKSENVPKKFYLISVLICFAFLPYYFVVSGIRNGVAMCIMGLAIYQYLYKKKSIVCFLIIGVIAATMHMSVVISIPFVIASRFELKIKNIIIVLFSASFVGILAKTISEKGIPYLSGMARSYIYYSSDGQFTSAQYFLKVDLILIILFLVVMIAQYKEYIKGKEGEQLYKFVILYGAYILGNFGNYDLVLRPAYLLGTLTPVLSGLLYNGNYWKRKAMQRMVLMMVIVLVSCYTIARYLTYFFSIVKFS